MTKRAALDRAAALCAEVDTLTQRHRAAVLALVAGQQGEDADRIYARLRAFTARLSEALADARRVRDRRRGWEKTPPPTPGLPTYAPMRTVPSGLHTPQQWRRAGRRVLHGAQPVGYGWRQPGRIHGHYYGGWLPLHSEDQTCEIASGRAG